MSCERTMLKWLLKRVRELNPNDNSFRYRNISLAARFSILRLCMNFMTTFKHRLYKKRNVFEYFFIFFKHAYCFAWISCSKVILEQLRFSCNLIVADFRKALPVRISHDLHHNSVVISLPNDPFKIVKNMHFA